MRDKQIEEMATAIFSACNCGLFEDEAYRIAEFVIERLGYRKQSEVAKEIFGAFRAEMRSEIARNEALFAEDEDDFYEGRNDAFRTAINRLAELKKKYTEEGK